MRRSDKNLISEAASVFETIDSPLENGETARKIKAIENVNGVDIKFSLTRQLPLSRKGERELALCAGSGYLYRGTASVMNPLNNKVLEFEGKKRREILSSLPDGESMIEGTIPLTRKAERALKCTHQIYFNDDREERIREKIEDIARKMYLENMKQLNRLIEKRTNPATITPAEAASLYFENYIAFCQSNASDDCNAKRRRTIEKYYALMDNIPMAKYSFTAMGKFIKRHHISKMNVKELHSFWMFCIKHSYCLATDPFDEKTLGGRKKSAKAEQNAAMERRCLDDDETEAFFCELEKADPAMACGAGLVFLDLPDKLVAKMPWERVIFKGSDYAVLQICDIDLEGKERSGATHNLSFVMLPQVAAILYKQWNSLIAQYSEKDVRQMPILSDEDGNQMKIEKLRSFIAKTVAGVFNHTSNSYSYRLPGNIGNAVLANTYKDIIDTKCGIPENDIGTRRFLKHMSMAGDVTSDHYVPFVGDEAWDFQYTSLRRQMPPVEINEVNRKESHDGITTETLYPDDTSENVNLHVRVKLKPGEVFTVIGKHAVTGSFKRMKREDVENAA